MIWQSTLMMGLIDVAIVAASVSVVLVFISHRRAVRALRLHKHVAWIVGGMSLLALFYAGDLVVMVALPGLASPEFAMAAMTDLHLNWSWPASLLAVASIAIGLFGLLGRMLPSAGDSLLLIEAELDARLRSDEALRTSEALLRAVTDNLPTSISYVDRDRRVQFVNETYANWYGTPVEKVQGRYLWDLMDEERYKFLGPYFDAALSGKTVRYEHKSALHDGTTLDIYAIYVPDIGERGEVKGFVSLGLDISERMQAEAALRDSEALLRLITDNLPAAISYCDVDQRCRFINRGFERRFGATRDELIGREISHILGAERYEELKPFIETVLSGETARFEARIEPNGGGPVDLDVTYPKRAAKFLGMTGRMRILPMIGSSSSCIPLIGTWSKQPTSVSSNPMRRGGSSTALSVPTVTFAISKIIVLPTATTPAGRFAPAEPFRTLPIVSGPTTRCATARRAIATCSRIRRSVFGRRIIPGPSV